MGKCQSSTAAEGQATVTTCAAGTLLASPNIKASVAPPQLGPLCVQNTFYPSPAQCKTQKFCASPSEVTAEWLSDALNAEVLSFTPIICGQGQLGVTVVVQDIKYSSSTTGRPASVAIKIHTQTDGTLPLIRLLNAYSRELFFYTTFAEEVPLKSPKLLGVWTDANGVDLANGAPVEAFNLMMENLGEEWEGYDTATSPPTFAEFERIVLAVLPMHVKFWKSPLITQRPFSESGAKLDFFEKFRPLQAMVPQLWPPVRAAMPQLAGWGSSWPTEFSKMVDFIDRFAANPEQHSRLIDVIETIQQSRPMTLVHGDLNAGNVWKSKTNSEDLLFCDYQLLKMAPIGFDFGTMLVVLPDGPSGEETTALMRAYHAKLPSAIREEYTYSQLRDDFRCQTTFLMLGMSMIMAGQLDPSSMDATKFEFTWKSYWPSVFRRLLQLYQDEEIEEFTRQLLEGEYRNFGN